MAPECLCQHLLNNTHLDTIEPGIRKSEAFETGTVTLPSIGWTPVFSKENTTSPGVTAVLPYKTSLLTVLGEPVTHAITTDQVGSTRIELSVLTTILASTHQDVTVPGTETTSSLSLISRLAGVVW